ncbi:MAG: hypothetical protein R6X22_13625 [Gemmatimonadota bacterium]
MTPEVRHAHRARKLREELVVICHRVGEGGLERWSLKAAYNVLRWHRITQTRGDEPFKLNDHFTALYARLIMVREPDLEGFFEAHSRSAA